MGELDFQEEEIDSFLRRSMSAPVPSLPPEFDKRVIRKIGPEAGKLKRFRKTVLAGYTLTSADVSEVAMRGQGLAWGWVDAALLGALATCALVPFIGGRSTRTPATGH